MPEGTTLQAVNNPDIVNPDLDVYNGLREGATVSIRYAGALFQCKSAGTYNPFYPSADFPASPNGFAFGDLFQPAPELLFFGDGTTLFDMKYDDMCGTHGGSQVNGNLPNQTQVTKLP